MESREQDVVDEMAAGSSMELRAGSSNGETMDEYDDASNSYSSSEGQSETSSYDSDDEEPTHGLRRSERLDSIIFSLDEETNSSVQLVALNELCNLLNYCTEDLFSGEIADLLSPLLVRVSQHVSSPEVMLLAIRAMTYMCDVYPQSSSFLVHQGAVDVLCGKLLVIEYMDVAEESLQALKKISRVQPLACLESGALLAVLCYIDFFSTSVQRVAVCTTVNICRNLPSECPSLVVEAVPMLCNLLQSEDQQLVENAAISIIKIAEHFNQPSESLDELCRHLIQKVTHLINPDTRASLSKETYNSFITLLAKLCAGSFMALKSLYELDISIILKDIISSHDISHGMFFSSAVGGHHNQVPEILKLLHELLPTSARNQDVQQLQEKESFLISRPDLLQKFAENMLPLLFQVVSSGASVYACYGCLSVIDKLVYLCKSDMLVELLKNANIASFVAGVLSQKDPHVRFLALEIANVILQRHSDAFLRAFEKEGVFFAIDALSTPKNCSRELISVQQPDDLRQKPSGEGLVECLCYAFSTGLAHSPSELRTCKLEKNSILQLAKQMGTDYTPESCGPKIGVTNVLQQLKNLASTLNDLIEMHLSYGTPCEKEFQHILQEIKEKVTGREHVSTFEFIESGIVKSLVSYLFSDLNGRNVKESRGYHTDIRLVQRRSEMFARTFMSYSDEHAEEATPVSVLTRKLHSALSFLENFPVVLNPATKRENSFAVVPNECFVAHPCLKISFVREEGETCLSDYSNEYVTVDPFASLDAVKKYLWPKEHASRTEQVKSCHSAVDQTDICPSQDDIRVLSEANKNLNTEDFTTSSPIDNLPKLLFFFEGRTLDLRLNLYQAIFQQKMKAEHVTVLGPDLWSQVYTIKYKRDVISMQDKSQESNLIEHDVPHASNDILLLLKGLEEINRSIFHLMSCEQKRVFAEGKMNKLDDVKVLMSAVPQNEFLSNKLTIKLEQQMCNLLVESVGAVPLWWSQLMASCPFLFTFDAKCKYFRLAAFGMIQSQLQLSSHSDRRVGTSSLPHRKFLISRNQILESATQIMELHVHNKVPIEVEYKGEVGTGLGPTLEFYTLVSHEFQKPGLGMWRDDRFPFEKDLQVECSRIVLAPFGLFPRPWPSNVDESDNIKLSEVVKKFVLLGRVVAKALQEGRMLDFPFSRSFYKLILGQELTMSDISSFDPELGRILLEFQALADRKKVVESDFGQRLLFECNSCYRDTKIEDLCLDFTLPGYPDYAFTTDPDHTMVSMSNLDSYITHIVDATVHSGISRQVKAFKCGFNEVFPIENLEIFTEEELEHLLCGDQKSWNFNELIDHIKFDHGYTASSPPIINLLELIQEFDSEQRRAFVRFVTGAPQLPPGGLASLNPKLTVVRKLSANLADTDLPSVMTCANYLKLPPYSSKEVMKEKLLYAITEGQGSFHLS